MSEWSVAEPRRLTFDESVSTSSTYASSMEQ